MSELTSRTADLWKRWRKADAEVHRIAGEALRDAGAVQSEVLVQRTRAHARAIDQRVAILRDLDEQTQGSARPVSTDHAGTHEVRKLRAAE